MTGYGVGVTICGVHVGCLMSKTIRVELDQHATTILKFVWVLQNMSMSGDIETIQEMTGAFIKSTLIREIK